MKLTHIIYLTLFDNFMIGLFMHSKFNGNLISEIDETSVSYNGKEGKFITNGQAEEIQTQLALVSSLEASLSESRRQDPIQTLKTRFDTQVITIERRLAAEVDPKRRTDLNFELGKANRRKAILAQLIKACN